MTSLYELIQSVCDGFCENLLFKNIICSSGCCSCEIVNELDENEINFIRDKRKHSIHKITDGESETET